MAVATPAKSAALLELRSAALTLVAVVLKTTDLAVLAQELAERVAMTPDLFDNDAVADRPVARARRGRRRSILVR